MSCLIEHPFIALLLLAALVMLGCLLVMPRDQTGDMPEELQEVMRRNNFAVRGGEVYCTECPSTGSICGQCSNSGQWGRCQQFFDERGR